MTTMVSQDAMQVQPLRGSMVDASAFVPPGPESAVTRFGMNTLVMSPLMAQILSAQDRMASIAAVFAPDDEPDPRTSL
jgi:hypothetical protein